MRLFEGTKFDIPPRCDRCGLLEAECKCPPPTIPPESQTVRLAVEKRKKGKVVTVLRGLAPEGNHLPELLRQLKSACGTGGTVKDDEIELQGDHLKRAGEILAAIGYRVRRLAGPGQRSGTRYVAPCNSGRGKRQFPAVMHAQLRRTEGSLPCRKKLGRKKPAATVGSF